MNIVMFMFILGSMFISHSIGLFTSENIVFQKSNKIFINDVYVTFVHDLRPFQHLINQIQSDLKSTNDIIPAITKAYKSQNMTGYVETFKSLHIEVDILYDEYMSVYNNFDEYQTLSYSRNERSLVPIIGQLMSTLFGTVSENDLENINRNINNLANQKQIIHDLDVSLSILNLIRMQVAENRRSIMDFIIVVQKLDRKISKLAHSFETKLVRVEQFIHTYLQFQMILDEIRSATQDGLMYLENLKAELNMLSIHHLSTLTCITYLEDNEIRIILKIPLMNTKQKYEVYKVHNLPMPLHHVFGESHTYLVKYNIETTIFMVSEDRTKFSLLSENNYQLCNGYHYQFCNPETAFYLTNINKFCLMALFMKNQADIKTLCKQSVVLNQKLPLTKYMSFGIWIIINREPLTFTLNCQSYKPKDNVIRTEIPFGIVKLNNSCMAFGKHLQLSAYFGKHGAFEMSDPMYFLLKIRNISNFHIWNYSKTEFTNLKSLSLPSSLQGLKEIPMQSFIHGIKSYKTVNVNNDDEISWSLIVIILIASVVSVITLICMIRHRRKLHFCQAIGKRLANEHDLRNVNVKRSLSNDVGEQIEMSALIDTQNVNNGSEGRNSFKRTDASLAWAPCQK